MKIFRTLNYFIKFNLFTVQVIMFSFFCFSNELNSQILQIEDLFNFESVYQQKNIRISERIKEEWNLQNSFIQLTYYNANKDNHIDSVQSITQVLSIHYLLDNTRKILELFDDGQHFDKEANDYIYANFLVDNFKIFNTVESIIDVQLDTIGINYAIIYSPVKYMPETPKIIIPQHNSVVSSTTPVITWEIDQKADGCGVILLDNIPNLGMNFKGIVWEKRYTSNNPNPFTEKIPVPLLNNHTYTLLIWSYTNTKILDNEWSRGAYSFEWSKFRIDTTLQVEKDLMLSQNYPNPFNSRTIIKYNLPADGKVTIKIFDILAREITTLINQVETSGEHYVSWYAKNNSGNNVTSGVYFYNMLFNNRSISRKMILAR